MKSIRIAQFGLGPIGIETVKHLASTGHQVVGAIDNDPAKVGRDLGELTGVASLAGVYVYPTVDALWAVAQPAAVVQTTVSKASLALEQLRPLIERGCAIVSSCEELVYPRHRAPAEAALFDALCKTHGARVVASGINPGFLMDLLPVVMSAVQRKTVCISCKRVVNASLRRQPLQKKIGSGMEPAVFSQLFREGRAGHAGFSESVCLIAHTMGWALERIEETCEPVVADKRIQTTFFTVQPGQTRGLYQIARGFVAGEEKITLSLTMALDEADPHDAVFLDGEPPVNLRLAGGTHGDVATVATLVNTLPRVLAATPGLKLITELPVAAP
ncbi:MAG: dihydrodipicolinate reductase [Verrucomicrobiota bacterium]|nr:dihydrodipicolinate reductase [Verrucomicrobiota bacterium]